MNQHVFASKPATQSTRSARALARAIIAGALSLLMALSPISAYASSVAPENSAVSDNSNTSSAVGVSSSTVSTHAAPPYEPGARRTDGSYTMPWNYRTGMATVGEAHVLALRVSFANQDHATAFAEGDTLEALNALINGNEASDSSAGNELTAPPNSDTGQGPTTSNAEHETAMSPASAASETGPAFPYESLNAYYARSSYGKLSITGESFDYHAQHERDYYTDNVDALFTEALTYLDPTLDLARFDANDDGLIDAIYLRFSGEDDDWGSTWWSNEWVFGSLTDETSDDTAEDEGNGTKDSDGGADSTNDGDDDTSGGGAHNSVSDKNDADGDANSTSEQEPNEASAQADDTSMTTPTFDGVRPCALVTLHEPANTADAARTIIHETGHVLGLPDFYSYTESEMQVGESDTDENADDQTEDGGATTDEDTEADETADGEDAGTDEVTTDEAVGDENTDTATDGEKDATDEAPDTTSDTDEDSVTDEADGTGDDQAENDDPYPLAEVSQEAGLQCYDMMMDSLGDHNGFSKWLMGWLDEDDITRVTVGGDAVRLSRGVTREHADIGPFGQEATLDLALSSLNGVEPGSIAVISDHEVTSPFDTYYLVEYNEPTRNNTVAYSPDGTAAENVPAGFRIWRVRAEILGAYDFKHTNAEGQVGEQLIELVDLDAEFTHTESADTVPSAYEQPYGCLLAVNAAEQASLPSFGETHLAGTSLSVANSSTVDNDTSDAAASNTASDTTASSTTGTATLHITYRRPLPVSWQVLALAAALIIAVAFTCIHTRKRRNQQKSDEFNKLSKV